ncbi:pentapeptide repeat-containing protein [Rhizobium leguminosarum]|uniref:pentapeptide repeat-containing protein n=1 Tax=Rhizobium leguminosarum TaxID=384 RepID=UPI001032410A|nr:pentapeptide repeat-containing protein [Rhizobium leguminosarum]TBG66560.1 hypothetical protein ELG74_01085 [Rhizobium leguminosarum]
MRTYDFERLVDLVIASERTDFETLLKIARLDKGQIFRHRALRGLDFSGLDLTGFDFTGSTFENCNFDNAHIGGDIFDPQHAPVSGGPDNPATFQYELRRLASHVLPYPDCYEIADKIVDEFHSVSAGESVRSRLFDLLLQSSRNIDKSKISDRLAAFYFHRYAELPTEKIARRFSISYKRALQFIEQGESELLIIEPTSVVILHNDLGEGQRIGRKFEAEGFEVVSINTRHSLALKSLQESSAAFLVVNEVWCIDPVMKTFLLRLLSEYRLPIIILSNREDITLPVEILAAYLKRPFTAGGIKSTVSGLLVKRTIG